MNPEKMLCINFIYLHQSHLHIYILYETHRKTYLVPLPAAMNSNLVPIKGRPFGRGMSCIVNANFFALIDKNRVAFRGNFKTDKFLVRYIIPGNIFVQSKSLFFNH